jgi:hypothetical protein
MDRLRVLTWNVHGGYLASLAHIGHTIYLPVRDDPDGGYGGKPDDTRLPPSLVEVPAEGVRDLELDVVLFQSPRHFLEDQYAILSDAQRRLPQVYLEHDPPREHPTDTHHPVDDPTITLVHCTAFNALMWDNGRSRVRIVDHGVPEPHHVEYDGGLRRGISVVNDLPTRGRRLGLDVFEDLRERVPIDLLGLGSQAIGGLGPVRHDDLPSFISSYRFFLNPIRYTSLGLAMIEAMLVGLPVVGLATTELPTVFRNGETAFLAIDPTRLVEPMRALLDDPHLARRIGAAGRDMARERFGIDRFARDWTAVLTEAVDHGRVARPDRQERDATQARTIPPPTTPAPRAAPAAPFSGRDRRALEATR